MSRSASALGLEPKRHIRAHTPFRPRLVERDRGCFDFIAERAEQPLHERRIAAHRQRRDRRFERDCLLGQLWPLIAAPGQRRAQRGRHRNRKERGRGIGPVVDILVQQPAFRPAIAAHQRYRVEVQKQREGAAILAGFGIEQMRAAEGKLRLLAARRVLVQEIAEVRGRPVLRGNRQQHERAPSPWRPSRSTAWPNS